MAVRNNYSIFTSTRKQVLYIHEVLGKTCCIFSVTFREGLDEAVLGKHVSVCFFIQNTCYFLYSETLYWPCLNLSSLCMCRKIIWGIVYILTRIFDTSFSVRFCVGLVLLCLQTVFVWEDDLSLSVFFSISIISLSFLVWNYWTKAVCLSIYFHLYNVLGFFRVLIS